MEDMPLSRFLHYVFGELLGVNYLIADGLTNLEAPVSLSLRNVTLRSFLRLLLRELDLTYIVRDEVLQVTTKEAAEANLVLQTYPFPKSLIEKSERVIAALTATVTPDLSMRSLGLGSVS